MRVALVVVLATVTVAHADELESEKVGDTIDADGTLTTGALGFQRAAKLDPSWNIAAYNLASASNLLNDRAGALAGLTTNQNEGGRPNATYDNGPTK